MEKRQIVKKRIEWVDIAKAITIILVIVGHTVDGLSGAIIYSFHMPLFFILSAYTFKCSENKEQFVNKTEKAFKHLIIPVLILIFIGTCKNIVIQFPNMNNWNFILLFAKREILKWCFASGCDVQILFRNIEGIGMPWFLVVLFIGRTLFDYLHQKLSDKKLFIWCCILSALGVVIGKIQFLPLSFDIVLAIMPLFYIGHKLDYFDIKTNCTKKMIFLLIIWSISAILESVISNSFLDIAKREYVWYPFCFLIAIMGSVFIIELSIIISKHKKFLQPVLYLGKNTLRMFFIHVIDLIFLYKIWYKISDNLFVNAVYRTMFNLIVFILVSFVIEAYRKHIKNKLEKGVKK